MRIELLQPEPELEFGSGGRCQDIKFGIGHYGTFDFTEDDAPHLIKLGLVGTDETLNSFTAWLTKCQGIILGKKGKQPRLFPPFPGFTTTQSFHSRLTWNQNDFRTINLPFGMNTITNFNEVVEKLVDLYVEEIAQIIEKSEVNVIICAISLEHLKLITSGASDEELEDDSPVSSTPEESESTEASKSDGVVYDFHDLLKARCLHFRVPLQMVLPATYDETKASEQKKILNRDQQDEATRAWNIHTALYYKSRGIPWRMVRESTEISTCYLGVSFFHTLNRESVYASSAQVFNERGEGVVVRGGLAYEDKEDRQLHLDKAGAYNLILLALDAFKGEHFHYPARVVIHKTSPFTQNEIDGFRQFLDERGIDLADFVYLRESFKRLFRPALYPPVRGTLWHLEDRKAILYTKGSIPFYDTYPGSYPPKSVYLDCTFTQKPIRDIARECLALSKMNWNNTRFDGQLPITLRAARKVGSILKYLKSEDTKKISSSYRFYM